METVKVIIETTLSKTIEMDVPSNLSLPEANQFVKQKLNEMIANNDPSLNLTLNDKKETYAKLNEYPIWIDL